MGIKPVGDDPAKDIGVSGGLIGAVVRAKDQHRLAEPGPERPSVVRIVVDRGLAIEAGRRHARRRDDICGDDQVGQQHGIGVAAPGRRHDEDVPRQPVCIIGRRYYVRGLRPGVAPRRERDIGGRHHHERVRIEMVGHHVGKGILIDADDVGRKIRAIDQQRLADPGPQGERVIGVKAERRLVEELPSGSRPARRKDIGRGDQVGQQYAKGVAAPVGRHDEDVA